MKIIGAVKSILHGHFKMAGNFEEHLYSDGAKLQACKISCLVHLGKWLFAWFVGLLMLENWGATLLSRRSIV